MVLAVLALLLAAPPQGSSPEQLFQEAVAAQQRGDDTLAIRKYGELLKLRPDVIEARANLGAALARLGRYGEAIEEYRTALAASPENAALRLNLALAYYKKGDLANAVKQLSPLHAAQPGDIRIATLLGDCYARLGQDTRLIALLTPVEAAHPEDLGVAWVLGSALIRSGDQARGQKLVEKVARLGHSAEAYLLAGQTALKRNEFEVARDHADAAMRLNPRLPGLLTLRGTVLQYLGDNPGAISALRQAIQADPKDFEAHLTLGAVLITERDLDGARQHLDRAVELNPSSNLARYELARVQRTQGQLDAALKNFEKVVHDDPNWAQPHLDLATLYFRLKRPEDGQRERALFDRLSAGKPKQ